MDTGTSVGMAAFGLARADRLASASGFKPDDISILASALGEAVGEAVPLPVTASEPVTAGEGLSAFGIVAVEPSVLVSAWRSGFGVAAAMATFTAGSVREACVRGLAHGSDCFGFRIPADVEERLVASLAPGKGRFFRETAYDRMAEHVIGEILHMPGSSRSGGDVVIWAWAGPASDMKAAVAWLSPPGPGSFAARIDLVVPGSVP